MTPRIQSLLRILKEEAYKENRSSREIRLPPEEEALPPLTVDALAFRATLEAETPYLLPGQRIGFNRSNTEYYRFPCPEGGRRHLWGPGNVVPDYEKVLQTGMEAMLEEVASRLSLCRGEQREFLEAARLTLEAALAFADRCRLLAEAAGAAEFAACLERVPRKGATTLLEACVFLKFLIFTLRCNRNIHITLGRFDRYMEPYYQGDRRAGVSREALLETVQEFFVSVNFDTDLYHGIQKGDNGQSLVLGGNGCFGDFSRLCMEASLELNLIDPKINLRVDRNTPDDVYEFATQMTKQGMGFPQYCNDDVVIPGLIRLGYAPEDAANYAVAACWEFIIPGKGMDVPNALTMNFPKVVNEVVKKYLPEAENFDDLLAGVKTCVREECEALMASAGERREPASPYFSLFIQGCLETGRDVSQGGGVYHNYGCHGAGIATGADSLAAIREVIFEEAFCTKEQLLQALEQDFVGFDRLRNRLLACPKMGNGEEKADSMGYFLMEAFAEGMDGKPNAVGGVFRAGTGSAQAYYYRARKTGATADGRRAFAPFGCSFSPSLEAKPRGPLSCIRSFTGYDLSKLINGGPLTMELHDTVFRNGEGIRKTAQLVKAFIRLGGHQLQLNCLSREKLLDAMEYPERHKNLIVRVWGWSGYFNELELPFKEHILKRVNYTLQEAPRAVREIQR